MKIQKRVILSIVFAVVGILLLVVAIQLSRQTNQPAAGNGNPNSGGDVPVAAVTKNAYSGSSVYYQYAIPSSTVKYKTLQDCDVAFSKANVNGVLVLPILLPIKVHTSLGSTGVMNSGYTSAGKYIATTSSNAVVNFQITREPRNIYTTPASTNPTFDTLHLEMYIPVNPDLPAGTSFKITQITCKFIDSYTAQVYTHNSVVDPVQFNVQGPVSNVRQLRQYRAFKNSTTGGYIMEFDTAKINSFGSDSNYCCNLFGGLASISNLNTFAPEANITFGRVFQLRHKTKKFDYFTMSSTKKNQLIANGAYTLVSNVAYGTRQPFFMGLPVRRFINPANGLQAFSSDYLYSTRLKGEGYVDKGVVFYVPI